MDWLWIVLAAVGLFVAWWVLKIVMSLAVPPEVSGRALLKQELKRRGVDVGRIPDRAIDEMVELSLRTAKTMARVSAGPDDRNWRANLVRYLQAHAAVAQGVIMGVPPSFADKQIREILVRNGVVQA